MEKLKNKLKEKKGSMIIVTLGTLLVLSLIFMFGFEFMRIYTTAKLVQKSLGNSIVITNVQNMDDNFNGIREGYSGAYAIDGDEWAEKLEPAKIYLELESLLDLRKEGSNYVRYSNHEVEYRLSDLKVDQYNGEFAPLSKDTDQVRPMEASASVKLEIPVSAFGGYLDVVPPLSFRIKASSKYVPKF